MSDRDILEEAADRLDEDRASARHWNPDLFLFAPVAEHLREIARRHSRTVDHYGGCEDCYETDEPCPDRVSAEKLARTVTDHE